MVISYNGHQKHGHTSPCLDPTWPGSWGNNSKPHPLPTCLHPDLIPPPIREPRTWQARCTHSRKDERTTVTSAHFFFFCLFSRKMAFGSQLCICQRSLPPPAQSRLRLFLRNAVQHDGRLRALGTLREACGPGASTRHLFPARGLGRPHAHNRETHPPDLSLLDSGHLVDRRVPPALHHLLCGGRPDRARRLLSDAESFHHRAAHALSEDDATHAPGGLILHQKVSAERRFRVKTHPKSLLLKWVGCCSLAQSCLTLRGPMDCSTPGLPVHHQLPELTQTHVLPVG